MKNIKIFASRLAIVFLLTVSLASCKKEEPVSAAEQKFQINTEFGLYQNGDKTFVYDKYVHQIARNSTSTLFRLQKDDLSQYVSCTLTAAPTSKDQKIDVTMKTKGLGLSSEETTTFKVSKMEGDKVWLWNGKTGFIMSIESVQ